MTPGQVERRHPGWHVWPSVTGHLWYARRACSSPPNWLTGEDWTDLRDNVRAWVERRHY